MLLKRSLPALAALTLTLTLALPALAQEDVIRKNLAERLPKLPKIDEVSKTPVPGLYELRVGNEVLYTDEAGNHLIQGTIFDTRAKINLTEVRLEKLSAIEFASLPLQDALVVKQGSGARKMAVFADPNCGYCKALERDLVRVKDVTIYTFLFPILGPDSDAKARAIWCAKDGQKAWRGWMIDSQTPPAALAKCDSAALQRNTALGRKHRLTGTPVLVFQDGTRAPGAVPLAEVEKRLAVASAKP